MKFISQAKETGLQGFRGLLWLLYATAGAFWLLLGHYTSLRYTAVLLFLALITGLLSWFLPRRYLLPGLLLFCAPRLASIVAGHGHNTLWPFLLILALILWIREPPQRPGLRDLLLLTLFVALLVTLYRWQVEAAPGVSSAYASFLSLDFALHCGSALLFGSVARLKSRDWADLATGLALGGAMSAAVALTQLLLWKGGAESFALERLFAVTARSLEAGRLPGLASNASASAIVLPIGALCFLWTRRASGKSYWPFLFFLPVFYFQGKTLLLTLCGIALALPLLLPGRRKWLFLAIGPLLLVALLFFFYFILPSRWEDRWLSSAGSRALQWQAVWHLFNESPLAGHGLNSFMVVVRRVETHFPGLEVDNPPGLVAGAMVDGGVMGLTLVLAIVWLYLRRLPAVLRQENGAQKLIALIPIMIAPTFLTGQQLVLAEVAGLVLIPLALLLQPGPGRAMKIDERLFGKVSDARGKQL
ncbi:MAG: hypothetical protein HS115_12740 [Spirochaetales bacterium]|nr:hypothetical protein [Spirochaetales bacterium]